jgi:hypothetical protein
MAAAPGRGRQLEALDVLTIAGGQASFLKKVVFSLALHALKN